MWQRWNGTSHVFEKSDDNGSSWAPLPLSAATITEGTLPDARLSGNVAMRNASNMFTAGPQILNPGVVGAAYYHLRVNGATYGALGAAGALRGTAETDLMLFAETGKSIILTVNGNPTIEALKIGANGVITVNGAGPHNFQAASPTSVALYLTNLTNGTSAYSTFRCSAGSTNNYVSAFSQSYSSGGGITYDQPGSICLYGDGSGGISIVSAVPNTVIRFYVGGSSNAQIRHNMTYDGGFYPNNDNSGYIGYHTNRYSLIRGTTITPGDLTFDNGWTVTEAEKLGLGGGLAFLDADENLVALVGPQGFKDISAVAYAKTTKKQRSLMPRMDHPSLLDPRKMEVNG